MSNCQKQALPLLGRRRPPLQHLSLKSHHKLTASSSFFLALLLRLLPLSSLLFSRLSPPALNPPTHPTATLITPTWVLTASHCFMSNGSTPDWQQKFPAGIFARVGAHNVPLSGPSSACTSGGPLPEEIRIARVIGHPQFVIESYDYDMTLLELERPSTFAPVPSVALSASAADEARTYAVGKSCLTYGWGLTDGNNPSTSARPPPAACRPILAPPVAAAAAAAVCCWLLLLPLPPSRSKLRATHLICFHVT